MVVPIDKSAGAESKDLLRSSAIAGPGLVKVVELPVAVPEKAPGLS